MQFFGVIVDFLIRMINVLFMTSPIICILPEANIIMVPTHDSRPSRAPFFNYNVGIDKGWQLAGRHARWCIMQSV